MADNGFWLPPSYAGPTPSGALPPGMSERLGASVSSSALGDQNDPEMVEMVQRREAKLANSGSTPSPSMELAIGRPRDPMFYWEENNLPYKYDTPEGLSNIRKYARMLYVTHPIIGAAIDIFSSWPLGELELQCKDEALVEFYTDLFFDELDYEEHLINFGREYWITGEGWSLGSFNDLLGVWEDDELLDPEKIDVIRSPFLKEPRLEIELPDTILEVVRNREPKWEYEAIARSYPELLQFAQMENQRMPVSNILLKGIYFRPDAHFPRGLPILMRAFRTALQEEMLNAAMDAIADRMYTPLVLVRLGASAQQLGTDAPWIPTQSDITNFNTALNAALAADFRVLTHHFGVDMTPVFGREMMPRLENDFERIAERFLQVFGMSKTMLTGAGRGETYAADALNFELVGQLLGRYQKLIQKFFRERALVVAEAQGHYDYEVRGGQRYPVFEEVLETDPETGEQVIVEKPKLLVPELNLKPMNMRSEAERRQLIEALAQQIPISDRTRMMNVPVDLDEERELVQEEKVEKAVAAQETRRATYLALKENDLPIPQDLMDDFGPTAKVDGVDQPSPAAEQLPLPWQGDSESQYDQVLLPPVDETAEEEEYATDEQGNVIPLPKNKWLTTPDESTERMDDMPRQVATKNGSRQVPTHVHDDVAAQVSASMVYTDSDDQERSARPGALQKGPAHIGMRAQLDPNIPLDEQMERV